MTKPRWWISLLVTGLGLLTLRVNAAPAFLPAELVRGDDALASGKPSLALSAYQPLTEHPAALRLATLRIAQAQMTLARQENSAAAFTAACAAWLDVVRFEGFSTQVRRHLAECKLGQGDSLGAAHEWEQVVAVEPGDTSFWALLAPAHLAHEEWDAAGRAYRALAQAEPANTEYRYWAGLLNFSTNPAVAQQDLLAAKSDPLYLKRAGTLLAAIELAELDSGRLGLVYLSVGEPGLALPYLQEAGRENDNAAIWAYLGLAQDQLGKNGYAALARALELDPDSPVAHSLMGRHWQRLGRPDLARPEYVNAWQLAPDNPALLADVAAAYEAEGDVASAEAWYQAAVRRAPDNVDFWILLSRFYLNSGPESWATACSPPKKRSRWSPRTRRRWTPWAGPSCRPASSAERRLTCWRRATARPATRRSTTILGNSTANQASRIRQ